MILSLSTVNLNTNVVVNNKFLHFLDPNRPVWEFTFENVDGSNSLDNTGIDPSSLSLKINKGNLVHHPGRRGKVIHCEQKTFCVDTTFNPDSEAGKCMKYEIRITCSFKKQSSGGVL